MPWTRRHGHATARKGLTHAVPQSLRARCAHFRLEFKARLAFFPAMGKRALVTHAHTHAHCKEECEAGSATSLPYGLATALVYPILSRTHGCSNHSLGVCCPLRWRSSLSSDSPTARVRVLETDGLSARPCHISGLRPKLFLRHCTFAVPCAEQHNLACTCVLTEDHLWVLGTEIPQGIENFQRPHKNPLLRYSIQLPPKRMPRLTGSCSSGKRVLRDAACSLRYLISSWALLQPNRCPSARAASHQSETPEGLEWGERYRMVLFRHSRLLSGHHLGQHPGHNRQVRPVLRHAIHRADHSSCLPGYLLFAAAFLVPTPTDLSKSMAHPSLDTPPCHTLSTAPSYVSGRTPTKFVPSSQRPVQALYLLAVVHHQHAFVETALVVELPIQPPQFLDWPNAEKVARIYSHNIMAIAIALTRRIVDALLATPHAPTLASQVRQYVLKQRPSPHYPSDVPAYRLEPVGYLCLVCSPNFAIS